MSDNAFAKLDPSLPLALLPVRLEARYLPRRRPTHLFVRIFPDVIHADGHRRLLSPREARIGRQYWRSVWAQSDPAAITEARRWLAAQTGPYRALWVSTTTRPTNLDSGDPEPVFADVPVSGGTVPVIARLLPGEWMVRLYDADLHLVHTAFSATVPPNLPMGPTLSSAGADATHPVTGKPLSAPEGFLHGQGLLWTIDFDEAERVGMGVRIAIEDVPNPVGALIVLGARALRDPQDEGTALDELLDAHWYSRGLDLVPQGTRTNNTDAGRSHVSLSSPDIEALFEREASERPIAPLGRAVLIAADAALMYRIPAADASSLAFGRIRANALDRTVHADWGEGAAAWAMNVVLGYATLGRYLSGPLSKLDGSIATGDFATTFRDWYVDWVRGGGPLPILRCGEQPYGLLPITSRPPPNFGATAFEDKLQHYLSQLYATWKASLPVPTLDPDATDGPASGSSASDALTVAEVLAAVPHPIGLRLRGATNHLPDDIALFNELIQSLEVHINGDNLLAGTLHQSLIYDFWQNRKYYVIGDPDANPPVPPPGIGTQLANLELYRQEVDNADDVAEYVTTANMIRPIIDDDLLPLLQMHRDATNAVPQVLWNWNDGGGLGAENVIRLVGTTFDETTEEAHDLVTASGDVAEIRNIIGKAVALLDAAIAGNVPPNQRDRLVNGAASLLAHFLDVTCRTVPVDDIGPVRLALLVLQAMIDHPSVTDAADELERLMRETLGLAMYRLDAWVTSIAAQRLASKRRQSGAGVQIGGYGWLLDLKKSDDPASQGFIHAPSLTHAATAAVLRSGWSAYGTNSGETPLSVDLSSDRVRGGQWILDGVRNGQDLAELLGARFERYLHDAHLDDWIRTVRVKALDAVGSNQPPNAVVDGLLVARAASDIDRTERENDLRVALDAALAPTTDPAENARRQGVKRSLRAVAADLDSVADLMLTQSVHAILQGNPDAAAAMMAVTGGGDGAVPPISVTSTQRDARLVSHRIVAIWKGDLGTSQAPPTPVYQAEPRLLPWLDKQLPDPAHVAADVIVRDATGTVVSSGSLKLQALGLSAAEAAFLAGSGATQARSRLGRLMTAAALVSAGEGMTIEIDFGAAASLGAGEVSVDEFGLIAAALQDALGRCRPLRGDDLVMPGSDAGAPAIDIAELSGRLAEVEKAILELINGVGANDTGERMLALRRSAVIGVEGAAAAIDAGSAGEPLARVIGALKARLIATGEMPSDPAQAAIQRLRTLTGGSLPILPVFTPSADPDRAASVASATRRRQVAAEGHRWLRQAGRVRASLGPMVDWLLLSETTRGRPVSEFGLAQLPEMGGPWAAVGEPTGPGARLCLLSLTGIEALGLDAQPIAGLLVDSWTEGIPKRTQQTGIAVHFDAPTARPPQAVLLSVVEDETGFSADELADQLLHTIELAKYRAVAADRIVDLGHYLPAVFLPDDVNVSGGVQ